MKKFAALILILAVAMLPFLAFADEPVVVGEGWSVSFTPQGKLENSYKDADLKSEISGLQPGDTMVLRIPVRNDNTETADWYMKNIVKESLEDASANSSTKGGGYSYRLTYKGPGTGETEDVIYDSEKVGGEQGISSRVGLHEATSNLEDYFFLDKLKPGESGVVELMVELDGESQGNDYQDTLARLQFRFAVELSGRPPVVQTGDNRKLTPLYIGMLASGLVVLYLVLDAVTDRIYGKKGGKA